MKAVKLFLAILLTIMVSSGFVKAQVCNGSFGDPVINIDFGRGDANFGPSINETNYTRIFGTPNDGQYTIAKTTAGMYNTWHQNVFNHTPNDPDGYFMIVNADYSKGVFYQKTIPVCSNTTYQFSAYIINLVRNSGIKPNVKFTIEYNGVEKSVTTGDIDYGSPSDWKKKEIEFTVPDGLTTITLKMTNENPGGIGNDVGIDDITFRACGPLVTSVVKDLGNDVNACEGGIFDLVASVSSGFNEPILQWQKFDGTLWTNIPNQNSLQITENLTTAPPGVYRYRLMVTEKKNVGTTGCSVASSESVITINFKPEIQANNVDACIGDDTRLGVSDAFTYKWRKPNGDIFSDEQRPTLPSITANDAGLYTVTVTNEAGCTNTTQVKLTVVPKVRAVTNITSSTICEGETVQLNGSGGPIITWSPIEGLSDSKIANPIASPKKTTLYTLTVSNSVCTDSRQILVTVINKPIANAGDNQKIIAGESVQLKGSALGNNISYFWTPTDFLDDPTSLNPMASPPATITYTLNVVSNCSTTADQVTVTVFPKIEFSNTFTPNGDGINDTWQIPFISLFPNAKLKIVNRAGNIVFENSKGVAWDGKSKGKDQPIGTYFYTLYLNEEQKIYSGWLLLTR